jgi:mono/diheme cytochrome c family protein
MMHIRTLGLAAVVSAALVSGVMAQTPDASAPAQAPAATPAPAQAPTAGAADPAAGEGAFKGRCAGCHEMGAGGAPDKATLATHTPADIFDILKNGPMMAMASGLSDDDMHNIAAYLTAPAKPAS